MQLIFLSTLEVRTEENRTRSAQVSITEHQGDWRVTWSEEDSSGKPNQDCWYEGSEWKGMLMSFREGLKLKRTDGYFPIIDSALPSSGETSNKNRELLKLQYYAEMNHSTDLFQELRGWRRQQAVQEGKSAFFVATNRMLYMLSCYLPQSEEELMGIPGFGKRKVEAYGKELLKLLGKVERTTVFPLDWVSAELNETDFEAWMLEQRRSREQQEQQRSWQRKQILEASCQAIPLSNLEKTTGLRRVELVRLIEELDREGYDLIPLVDAELQHSGEEQALWPTERVMEQFTKLGDRFLKPVLKALYTEEELKDKDMNQLYERLRLERIRYRKLAVALTNNNEAAVV